MLNLVNNINNVMETKTVIYCTFHYINFGCLLRCFIIFSETLCYPAIVTLSGFRQEGPKGRPV